MLKNKNIFSISETAETLIPDELGRKSYYVAFLLMILITGIIVILYQRLPPKVPIFFSLPWGEARLAPKLSLLILPIIIIVIMVLNFGLGRLASKLSPILPRALAVASAVIAGMLLIALLGILQSLIL